MFKLLTVISIGLMLVFGRVTQTAAQAGASAIAFTNSAGQLIVSGGDGGFRWIVTDPGQPVNIQAGWNWSPDGSRLAFGLGENPVRLMVGDRIQQTVTELGSVSAPVNGLFWTPDGRQLVFSSAGNVLAVDVSSGGAVPLTNSGASVVSGVGGFSPVSADGDYVFFTENGVNQVASLSGGTVVLAGANASNLPNGLWADTAPLVASWGFEGSSIFSVTHIPTSQTVRYDSGRSAPVNPVGWQPGSTALVYRDGSNAIRWADVGCLLSGCGADPLAAGVALLPASAVSIQVGGNRAYFIDADTVQGVDLSCVTQDNCLNSAVVLGGNAAPNTSLFVANGRLIYTGYEGDAYNPASYQVRLVDLSCWPSCQPQVLAAGGSAVSMSPDALFAQVEMADGTQQALNLRSGALTLLTDRSYGAVNSARWSR